VLVFLFVLVLCVWSSTV